MFIFISFISIYHRHWISITGVGLLLVKTGNLNFIIKFPGNKPLSSAFCFVYGKEDFPT